MTSKNGNKGRGSNVADPFMTTHVVARPLEGITGGNYADKAKQFIALVGEPTTIARRDGSSQGYRYEANLKQWGAWLAYYKRIGYPTHFMKKREFWTVPTAWPALFDVTVSIADDDAAGDAYLSEVRREEAKRFDSDRFIKGAAVSKWRGERRQKVPASHLAEPAKEAPFYRDPDEMARSRARLGIEEPKERIDL